MASTLLQVCKIKPPQKKLNRCPNSIKCLRGGEKNGFKFKSSLQKKCLSNTAGNKESSQLCKKVNHAFFSKKILPPTQKTCLSEAENCASKDKLIHSSVNRSLKKESLPAEERNTPPTGRNWAQRKTPNHQAKNDASVSANSRPTSRINEAPSTMRMCAGDFSTDQ